MGEWLSLWGRDVLTRCGARMGIGGLQAAQSAVNYLRIGRWMRDHGYEFGVRKETAGAVWDVVAERVRDRRVLYLEFGVYEGASMRYWSRALRHPEAMLHGFDSFEGLPAGEGPWRKGQFDTCGRIPEISDERVRFHKGWFEDVLRGFVVPEHDVLVGMLDADLYSSTSTVLKWLTPHVRAGSYLYFDEMQQVDHEARAFDEFLQASGRRFRGVSADRSLAHVFLECVA